MKEIALTFDDGPWGETTLQILDELIQRQIPATFMIWGEHALQYPNILKRAAEAKLFAFGNHTYSHPSLLTIPRKEILSEIKKTDEIVKKITGEIPRFIRPPFGDGNLETLQIINRPMICWSLDTESWQHHEAKLCLEKVRAAKDGDIVLMHDFQAADAKALPAIIDFLQQEDYVFKTIPDLLGNQLSDEPFYYYSRDSRNNVGFKK
ncbi:MAG: polysaccharide deacetylase family protein [Streptococcaceae bacterium]|jgi:peptidoglycan/xylan/chitin deacetylase (PgdA/CDA1 family)|nr:polysaccharide deacetylase family protein [Streptococcaceae bacterium]